MDNVQQASFWSDAAPGWAEAEEHVELVGGAPGRLAMDLLDLRPGLRLLDIGCGSGGTTVELARRTSPGGAVVGIDIAQPMLDRASQRPGAAAVELLHGDAQVFDFGIGRFDAAFSRFGVMFFGAPEAAFANIRRALRTGGRLAFACWQGLDHNDWMRIPATAAAGVIGSPLRMPPPGGPGPFSLAEPDRIRSVLGAAGFRDVVVSPGNDLLSFPASDLARFVAQTTAHGGFERRSWGPTTPHARRCRQPSRMPSPRTSTAGVSVSPAASTWSSPRPERARDERPALKAVAPGPCR